MIFKYIPYEWDEISYKHQHTLRHQSLWGEAPPWTHRRSYHGKVSTSHSATTDGSLTPLFRQSWSCYSLKGEEKKICIYVIMKPTRLLQCLNPQILPVFDLKVDKISLGCSSRLSTWVSDAGRWKTLRGPVVIDGNNLPSPVRIGLTDLPNIGGASGPPGPPVPASLNDMEWAVFAHSLRPFSNPLDRFLV